MIKESKDRMQFLKELLCLWGFAENLGTVRCYHLKYQSFVVLIKSPIKYLLISASYARHAIAPSYFTLSPPASRHAAMRYGNRAQGNRTTVTQFILLGLTSEPKLQTPLFMMFLMIYLITLMGNLGLITLIKTNPRLHTAMYFFLCNLSVIDLCYSSIFSPKLLIGFLVEKKTISYSACFVQHFFFLVFVTTEVLLLAAMAYDRYVAICNPLLYTISMPKRVCVQLVVGSYVGGILNSLIQTCCLLPLPFCGPNVINHYFCDTNPLLKLTCSDNHLNELLLVAFNGTISMSVLFIIVIS